MRFGFRAKFQPDNTAARAAENVGKEQTWKSVGTIVPVWSGARQKNR
jgi:hypothetical protein